MNCINVREKRVENKAYDDEMADCGNPERDADPALGTKYRDGEGNPPPAPQLPESTPHPLDQHAPDFGATDEDEAG